MKFGETDVKITIESARNMLLPELVDSVSITTEREGRPGRIEFSVYDPQKNPLSHGDIVRCYIDDEIVFRGFVFRLTYSQAEDHVAVVAYDQLRYLFNDCSYSFDNVPLSEIFKTVSSDLGLKTGFCDPSPYKINSDGAPIVFNSRPAINVLWDCMEQIRRAENRLLVLYDDVGKLCIRDISQMTSSFLIAPETSGDIITSTNIDESTYNRIRIVYGDGTKETVEQVHVVDGKGQEDIGVLAITKTVKEGADKTPEELKETGENWLKVYNAPVRKLELKNVIGDKSLRAGMYVPVTFDLDIHVQAQAYCIRTITHNIQNGLHTMDITLEGLDIL